MNKILKVVLALLVVVATTPCLLYAEDNGSSDTVNNNNLENITVFSSISEMNECEKLPRQFVVDFANANGTGAYAVYTYTHSSSEYSSNLGYHPSFSTWQGVSGYFFSNNSTKSMTVSLSISIGSVTIEVASSGSSSGFFVAADSNRLSRPYVYGTVCLDFYRVDIYSSDTHQLVSTATQTRFNKTDSALFYSVKYK